MDNIKWQQPIDKLGPVVKEAQEKLRAIDRGVVAAQSGATIDQQGNLHVEFLRREYVIDRDDLTVKRVDDSATPPSLMQSLLLTYLYTADGTPPLDRWMGFRELPNGLFYAQAFQGYTGDELVRDLNGDVAAFKRASEKLHGAALAIGDAGYVFQVLPRLKLAAVMWSGDDEFPAQAQALFQETARKSLREQERPLKVDIKHGIPIRFAHAHEQAVLRNTRIIDQDVHLAGRRQDLLHRRVHTRRLRNIGRNTPRLGT